VKVKTITANRRMPKGSVHDEKTKVLRSKTFNTGLLMKEFK